MEPPTVWLTSPLTDLPQLPLASFLVQGPTGTGWERWWGCRPKTEGFEKHTLRHGVWKGQDKCEQDNSVSFRYSGDLSPLPYDHGPRALICILVALLNRIYFALIKQTKCQTRCDLGDLYLRSCLWEDHPDTHPSNVQGAAVGPAALWEDHCGMVRHDKCEQAGTQSTFLSFSPSNCSCVSYCRVSAPLPSHHRHQPSD